jgi:dTDP-4-amino-4,6-dideoxygalactose transaminase
MIQRQEGPWYYEQHALGFNYRITDFQCALGISQLKKLDAFIHRRKEIVHTYNETFEKKKKLIVPFEQQGAHSSWHLYVLQFKNLDRLTVFEALHEKGLGVNVHYIPVHLQPYYTDKFGYKRGDYPKSEAYYDHAITLPLYPAMTDDDAGYVINAILETIEEVGK